MADNITINTISGSPVVKTDDDGSAHWPYIKVAFGANNTQTRVASGVAGLPVSVETGTNLIGDVGISGTRTSGGTSFYYNNDLDETKQEVKSSAGQIYWMHVINRKSDPLYLQMFNKTSAGVTVGTTTPDMEFIIPTQGNTNGAGFTLSIPNGISMSTGITIAATTNSQGAGAPNANECNINIGYF